MEIVKRKYGALQSPRDLRDYRANIPYKNIALPSEFNLSTTTIKDQGSVNSCVAHALSSMLENKLHNNYSTGWIYGYRPFGYYQGEGMYPREALKTLQKMGVVKNDDFPYNIEMVEAKTKVDENLTLLEAQADDYKITAYAKLNSINEIKSWLYTKNTPVPVSIATDNLTIDDNNIIQIPSKYPNSGHMMLIIGWNETGFIVQNSWGSSWGNNGTAILPYEYEIKEAWGVTMTDYQANNDVKKPVFNIIRTIIMALYNFIKSIFEGGNK